MKATGFESSAKVVQADFSAFLAGNREKFDVAFLDPPYRSGSLERALTLTAAHMNPGGVMVCEHPKDEEAPERAGDFSKQKSYRYGKIMLTSYRRTGEA